jgi:iron(III) transport system permease protein
MRSYLAQMVLALILIIVIGWPTLATILAASQDVPGSTGTGLLDTRGWGNLDLLRPVRLARTSLELVCLTEAIALPLGLPLAALLFRTNVWGRRVLLGLIGLAAFVPLPLHATAWLGAFGNAGRAQAIGVAPILVGLPGAAFVHAMAALPWVVLCAGVGLRTVEPELEESALLDMPAGRVFFTITLRRSLAAIAAAALAVAVLTAGDMTVTDLLTVRSYAEEAYLQYQLGHGPGAAAAVSLPPLFVLGGLIALGARRLLRTDAERLSSATHRSRVWELGRWRYGFGGMIVAIAGTILALPLATLVWRAGRVGGRAAAGIAPHWSMKGFWGTLRYAAEESAEPLTTSLCWSAVGATATVITAWALAWVCRRPGPWRWIAIVTVATALAAPGPVAGMALVLGYRMIGPIYDSAAMLVLADILRTLPFALLVLWPSVRTIAPEHLDAAAVDGCSVAGQIRKVAAPLTRGAWIAAWCLSFVLAMGELPATNLVHPPGVDPLPVVIWGLLHTGVESHLSGVALVMLAAISAGGLITIAAVRGALPRLSD